MYKNYCEQFKEKMFEKLKACIPRRQPPTFDSLPYESSEPVDENFNKYSFPDCDCVLPKRYVNVSPCGKGAFGYVFYAKDKVTGDYVAIKKISNKNADATDYKRNYREFKFLSLFDHKNLISLHSAYIPAQTLNAFRDMYLVMPFCRYTVRELIRTDQVHFSHQKISFLTYQVLCGLRHLQRIEIIHRDLKPGNMVVDLTTGNLKLIDFGMSRMETEASMTLVDVGTRCYNAPELAFETPYTNKVDMFSLGCTVFEMFTKRIFVLCRNDHEHKMELLRMFGTPDDAYLNKIKHSGLSDWIRVQPPRPQVVWTQLLPANVFPVVEPDNHLNTQNARELLQGLLQFDPANRFDVNQALQHEYFWSCRDMEDLNFSVNVYDPAVESLRERTVSDWKELMFNEIKEYEKKNDVFQRV